MSTNLKNVSSSVKTEKEEDTRIHGPAHETFGEKSMGAWPEPKEEEKKHGRSTTITSINPFTEEKIQEFPFISDNELLNKIEKGHQAFLRNKSLPINERVKRLMKLAKLLEQRLMPIAELITKEMGKSIAESKGEVKKAQGYCMYYAENAKSLLEPAIEKTEAKKSYVRLEPLGVIYDLVPFNYPVWLTFKGIIPALLLGNSILHRNSGSTPLCGLMLEDIFVEAGYNSGEFQNVFTSRHQIDFIMSNENIQGVSFTGSTPAGKEISRVAGKYAKRCQMELGGSDPFIALKDVNIDDATTLAVKSRMRSGGQTCDAGKRFIIEEPIYDKFKEQLIEKVKKIKIGNPMDETTELGPMARKDVLETLHAQVEKSVEQGGKLIFGGGKCQAESAKGFFFNPAIVEVPDANNIIAKEETFGPVFCLMKAKNEEEAIKLANSTEYGLGAVICTSNRDKAEELATRIDAGMVFINDLVRSMYPLPAGGVKDSGYGRQCGKYGLQEFANIKTIWIN